MWTKWQPVLFVTLPAATPGIFAAVLLGAGRAFGETMIVLMATGNASIMSFGISDPVRTMSATIGAEMAEVVFGDMHYGVLFLIGSILFIFTFLLIAAAEFWIRNKLIRSESRARGYKMGNDPEGSTSEFCNRHFNRNNSGNRPGAGEVSPILFTGAAYFLPKLPQDLSDQFMNLGYHIYIMATQSTNVEETVGIQYATVLVLLLVTVTLNFLAVLLRYKLRSKTI